MKTNYAEQLAWFEFTVKPHAITSAKSNTYCWHATKQRPPMPYMSTPRQQQQHEQPSLNFLETLESGSRKRRRVESTESPFLTTMDDSTVDDCEMQECMQEETTVVEQQQSDIRRTMSSSSVETVYFDAASSWPNESMEESIEELQISVPAVPTRLDRIKDKFKLTSFIPNQRESIEAALSNQDMLLVLPSGPLRNLCYIAPTSESNHTTIVIVPTLLYLTEQDDYYLTTYPITYLFTSKSTTYKKHWMSLDQLEKYCVSSLRKKKPLVNILYMTSQEFTRCKPTLLKLYKNKRIDRFILDEAHCLSQWGNDYQFTYLRCSESLKTQFPSIPITAITAIPNERIHVDIMNTLRISTCFKKSILL